MIVLHVTESYGGGVTSAINSYVQNSPQFDHYLCATPRINDCTGEEGESLFKDIFLLKRDFKGIGDLYDIFKNLKPDVIHIHSTYAGLLCRLLPFIPRAKSIYTPHGYAFLRDDHPVLLKAYYWMESLLSKRTRYIAGCGREECNVAASFIGKDRAIELINVCDTLPDVRAISSTSKLPVIGMVGRICNQKGYNFFVETFKLLEGKAHFKWIGGGDVEHEALLRDTNIEVTGWIPRAEVIAHLKGVDLYFHTAAWEGFPISVLEASQLRKPILLRAIEPFKAENLPVVDSVLEASNEIQLWLDGDKRIVTKLLSVSININEYHSFERLRQSLNSLYSSFN